MTKIKKIHLHNYRGYRDMMFDFTDQHGNIKNLSVFIGSNGSGKSTVLSAISLLSSASRFHGKNTTLVFRKDTYDPDYDPEKQELQISMADIKRNEEGKIVINSTTDISGLETVDKNYLKYVTDNLYDMEIKGIWQTDDGEKEVILSTTGLKKNELSQGMSTCFHYFIDADHPINTMKFQLHECMDDRFIELAEAIYGYKCKVGKKVEGKDLNTGEKDLFYIDCVLEKPWGDKVHFKRMSDGEKKIATLIRHLCDPTYMKEFDVILIDNIAMHIYWKRHKSMIDKLLEVFPKKQFIVTTHSGILSNILPKEYMYDLEKYKMEEAKRVLPSDNKPLY